VLQLEYSIYGLLFFYLSPTISTCIRCFDTVSAHGTAVDTLQALRVRIGGCTARSRDSDIPPEHYFIIWEHKALCLPGLIVQDFLISESCRSRHARASMSGGQSASPRLLSARLDKAEHASLLNVTTYPHLYATRFMSSTPSSRLFLETSSAYQHFSSSHARQG
jgi:hypothetical protein